ncbi:DUF4126 domain-containing protein [Phormidium sp. CLA17]|uniref:DUF4126 domain-containing protein n=1 Tax=Leptolyngbya sp. Cla-17 TaxID=2803751 RepID=UPI001493188E|nr:DUF4126 domain-containing protein [Leptolyngbya sp. Cla-17]MBM0742759.1 DUF4126 domain-containing protein [Leptolyngbya sp. Cla-17]
MLELLAVLSASAAAGLRLALPLLLIGLLYGDSLWSQVPILSRMNPSVVLGILVGWSLLEIFASKNRSSQRFLQAIQIVFSPIVGAIIGVAIARTTIKSEWLVWLLGITGGSLALVLQLVQTGWIYRFKQIPVWVVFAQDALCITLVFFAFDAPKQGGLIALLLLWIAIRSSKEWYRWYTQQSTAKQ